MLRAGEGQIAVDWQNGRSVITAAMARGPLQLLRPNTRGAPWLLTTNLGGGLVDGDDLVLRGTIAPAASLFVGTQAATKVYVGKSRITTELTIADDALVAMVSDPAILFAGASLTQTTRVQLAERGSLLWADCLFAGRSARGEFWHFDRFENRLLVERGDPLQPLVDESLRLASDDGEIATRMHSFAAIATIVAIGPRLADWAVAADAMVTAVERADEILCSFTQLRSEVWIIRAASRTPEKLTTALRTWLQLATLLGEDPFARRY